MYNSLSRTGKIIFWVINCAVWLALFTPLIISSGTLFPFQTGKGMAYRVLVEIAAFFYLLLIILEPKTRPKLNSKLLWSVAVFLIVLVITTIFSVNPYRAFWGDIERMEGFFGIAHGVLLFLVLFGVLRRREDWLWFFRISLAASFFVGFYALSQVYPALQFWGSVFEARPTQPGSTLGNPAFVSTYEIFQVFFALFLLLWEKRNYWKIFAAFFLIFNVVILYMTAIRGAQVGIMAAIFIGVILTPIFVTKSFKAKIASGLVIILMIAFVVGLRLAKNSPVISKLPLVFQRIAQTEISSGSAKTRLLSLEMSWQALKDRPVFGFGLENFKVGYNKHFNPEHLSYEQAWFDRAHNKIAEVAVTTGVVGLASYLAVFIFGFLGVVKFIKKSSDKIDRLLGVMVIMLGTAYFVQNLFLFDMPMSYLMFFSFLGFVGFLSSQSGQPEAESKNYLPATYSNLGFGPLSLIVAGALATLFLIFWANWRPYKTAALGRQAMDVTDQAQLLELYNQAKKYGGFSYSETIRVMEDTLINSQGARSAEWNNVFEFVKNEVEDFLAKEPTDPRFYIRTGKLYNERAFLEPQYLEDAERSLKAAIALSPTRPDPYYELGVTYLQKQDVNKALESFNYAVDLNPNNSRAHWVLGLAYFSLNMNSEGLSEIDKALQLGYNWDTATDINNLTQIYVSTNRSDKLVELYEKVVANHPEVAQYHVSLAIAYANVGEKEKAKEEAQKAVELDSQYEEGAKEFIKKLDETQ